MPENKLFQGRTPTMDGRIYQLQGQILKNPEYHWTVQKMAEMVELSVPHFQKLFKKETRTSPMAFLQNARLEKAGNLLETTFFRVQQIGKHVGMLHESHFTRDFKKKYGVTPSEYRRQYWEKIQAENQNGQK